VIPAGRTVAQRRGVGKTVRPAETAGDVIGPSALEPTIVTVHVPLAFRRRRGRKILVVPDGAGQAPLRAAQSPMRDRHEDTPAVRALEQFH